MTTKDELYGDSRHPYTSALMASVPQPDPDIPMGITISGEVASPINPPSGCRFHPRCPLYGESDICRDLEPDWREVETRHLVACHKVESVDYLPSGIGYCWRCRGRVHSQGMYQGEPRLGCNNRQQIKQ